QCARASYFGDEDNLNLPDVVNRYRRGATRKLTQPALVEANTDCAFEVLLAILKLEIDSRLLECRKAVALVKLRSHRRCEPRLHQCRQITGLNIEHRPARHRCGELELLVERARLLTVRSVRQRPYRNNDQQN